MNFELHKFKKISDTPKSAVLEHPDGHKITIAKHVLSPKLRDEVSKLPMNLAEGGEVSDEDLETEAKSLNNKSDKTNLQTEAQRSNADYDVNPDQYPEAKPVEFAQAETPAAPVEQTAQEPAQPIQPAQNGQPDYFTNGTFDVNKFVISSPHAPIEAKINALREMDKQDQSKQDFSQYETNKNAQETKEYNELASKRGLPLKEIPSAQVPTQRVADASPGMIQTQPEAVPNLNQIPKAPADPYGTQAYSQTLGQGISDVKQGIQSGAEAEGALGKEQAGLLENQVVQQQQNLQDFQSHYNQLDSERNAFQQDIQNQHIDAQHYLSSMGTGQKISTAIGLILGGMGGGLTGQENPALKFLQSQIDRDIESQKNELGKKENLLSANMRQFGNLKEATQMTQVMQSDIVKNQLAQAAAKSQDPIVRARAQQAIGQIDMQNAAVLSQIAMRKSLSESAQDPSTKLRILGMAGIIPKEQQESAFKELATAKSDNEVRNNVLSWFNQAAGQQTLGHRVLTAGLVTPQAVNNLKNELIQVVKQKEGRVTPTETDAIDKLVPEVKDTPDRLKMKLNALNQFLTEKMHYPQLESLGINPNEQSRFNTQGQKKFQLGAPVQGR